MDNFTYAAPRTLGEAYALLANGQSTTFLAGGTDVIVQLREARKHCDQLIDLKHIPELMSLTLRSDGSLAIGAAMPCAEIYENAEATRAFPALIDVATLIGGIQIQGRASLGGNLCNASPAGDSACALAVQGARLLIGSSSGEREIVVEDLFAGPGENTLKPGEILVQIMIPAQPANSGARYIRFIPRNEMDIAVASAGARITLAPGGDTIESAKIAIGAVAPTPLVVEEAGAALEGQAPGEEAFARAGQLAADAARPITDMRGSAAQRKHLSSVLTRRALEGALSRAKEAR